MADGSGSGSSTFLAFVLGGVIVVLAVLGFFMFTGGHFGGGAATTHTVNLNVKSH